MELAQLREQNATGDEVLGWAKVRAALPGTPAGLGLRLVLAAEQGSVNDLDTISKAIDQASAQTVAQEQAGKVALKGTVPGSAPKAGKSQNYLSQADLSRKMLDLEGDPKLQTLLRAMYQGYLKKANAAGLVPGPGEATPADETEDIYKE